MMTSIKKYSELITLPTFEERYEYLRLDGIEGREIRGKILVHHMNPITKEDILNRSKFLLDPEYLICTLKSTHDAIHYGDENLLMTGPVERRANDTCPWRK